MMKLTQPRHWHKDYKLRLCDRLKVAALTPASWLYQLGYKLHHVINKPVLHDDIFILCVGNITAGGTGKTPTVILLAEIFKEFKPVILSKGYGGSSSAPRYVEATDTAQKVGDEPLLMAHRGLRVITSRSRKKGVEFAKANKHTFIIMDDGMQSPYLKPDYNICVIDSAYGFGNEKPLPAGPLRSSLPQILPQIHSFIAIGEQAFEHHKLKEQPIYQGRFILDKSNMNENIYAFAGLGRPEKFYESLKSSGMSISGTKNFPDHHQYTQQDIDAIKRRASELNAKIVTTEKDAIKIDIKKHKIHVIKGNLELQNLTKLVQDITISLNNKLHP
jgi:tetraacyldisaccharide 4'-kinase